MNNLPRGVFFALLSALCFAVMSALTKIVGPDVSTQIIVFIRFAIGILVLLPWLTKERIIKRQKVLATEKIWLHILRGSAAFTALSLFYYSIKFLPLVDAVLLMSTFPFFVPLFARVALGINTSWRLLLGIFVGFIGVAMVLHPGTATFPIASLLPVAAAVFGAISMLSVRILSRSEKNLTIMIYYFCLSALISGLWSIDSWHLLSLHTWGLLLLIGIIASVYQISLTQALRDAPARIVSPLYYVSIPISVLLQWLIWHQFPDTLSLLGIVVVCLSAMYVVFIGAKRAI